MPKRRPALDPAQFAFTFEAATRAREPGSLANLNVEVAASVAAALAASVRSRDEIARAMTELLSEDVSRFMLDAYASEGRSDHNISLVRFLALVAVTGRVDALDVVARQVGGRVIEGEDIRLLELGHLNRLRADLDAQIRRVTRMAKPMKGIDHK